MLHKDLAVVDGIHIIHNWSVADAAARLALVVVATDIGKVAYQQDNKLFYALTDHSVVPTQWTALAGASDTDGLTEGATNKYFTTARVLATALTGLSTAAGTVVTAAHTILQAIGFLQKQITNLKHYIPIAASDETTALATGVGKVTFRMPCAMTLSDVRASLTTAQTSGTIFTADVKKNGATIFSTLLTIDNTEKSSVTAAAAAVISAPALASDDEITIDITQIGDGTAKGLKVYLIGNLA